MMRSGRMLCRMASRDSGKALVDAAFGELMVTCEKATWLATHGERYLRRERRRPGRMARILPHPAPGTPSVHISAALGVSKEQISATHSPRSAHRCFTSRVLWSTCLWASSRP